MCIRMLSKRRLDKDTWFACVLPNRDWHHYGESYVSLYKTHKANNKRQATAEEPQVNENLFSRAQAWLNC